MINYFIAFKVRHAPVENCPAGQGVTGHPPLQMPPEGQEVQVGNPHPYCPGPHGEQQVYAGGV